MGLELKPQVTTLIGKNDFLNSQTISRNPDFKLGYGLNIDFVLTEKISIGSGAYYNPQGIEQETVKIGNYEEDFFFHAEMTYLRIPLNFNYHFKHTENYNLIFSIGAGYNYLLDVSDDLRLTIGILNTPIAEPQDRYNQTFFDANVSMEFNYKILNGLYFNSKAEGIVGLTRFHAPYRIASNANVDINSRLLSVGISIGFNYLF